MEKGKAIRKNQEKTKTKTKKTGRRKKKPKKAKSFENDPWPTMGHGVFWLLLLHILLAFHNFFSFF
jgi:hypothetical protein